MPLQHSGGCNYYEYYVGNYYWTMLKGFSNRWKKSYQYWALLNCIQLDGKCSMKHQY